MKRALKYVIVIVVLGWGAGNVYLEIFGYTAAQVEKDLCGGNWMLFQQSDGFTSPLRCTQIPKTRSLPKYMERYKVNRSDRFTLSELDELCSPGTAPQNVSGKLECMNK